MTVPGIAFQDLLAPASAQDWLSRLLQSCVTLKLKVTSWQSGGVARTILAAVGFALSFEDSTTSIIAQGGFLDYAATGSVTFTNPDGSKTTVPVTPDPSKPSENPDGTPGWLDVLADGVYDVQRIQATFAGGPEAVLNTSVSTYGPFAAGTYHVADPFTSASYSNTSTLTIAPSAVVGTSITSVVSASGLVKIGTSSAHGLSSGAAVAIVGVTGVPDVVDGRAWYVDVVDSTHFTLRGSNFSGAYGGGGTAYSPTVASFVADVAGSASTSLDATGVANIHTVTQAVTSLTGVSVDNLAAFRGSDVESNVDLAGRCRLKLQSLSPNGPKGAYAFAALSSQQLALKLNPPQTLSQAITREADFADKSSGIVFVWIANASGAPSSGDVAVCADVIESFAEPLAVTSSTSAASQVNVTAVLDVWVPAALATDATRAVFQNALQTYFRVAPIGGFTDPGGAYTNVIPFDGVLGAMSVAAQAAQIAMPQSKLTLNGGTADISLALSQFSGQVAVLSPTSPTVNLHPI